MDPNTSDLAKKREDDMSSLADGFSVQMLKRTASAQGETTLGFEVYGEKCLKWSGPDEEARKSSAIIFMDSLEQSSDALLTLKGASQDASQESCASLEDEVPSGGFPNID